MNHWYDTILNEFIPDITPITLAADPHDLLSEENLQQRIRDKGFQFITFNDPVEFRFEYETRFRRKWLDGEPLQLVVVLRDEPTALDSLPHDLLKKGRKLSFSLTTLFPKLSGPVVAALEKEDLETLFKAQQFHNPGKLGENGTKEFILRHIFQIAPEIINESKDLLPVLLRLHYSARRIPHTVNQRLIHILRQNDMFDTWPLETIVPNREDFFAFLQERWSLYLDRLTIPAEDEDPDPKTPFKYNGPRILPFEHDDIRVYIDNLFNEGYLKPISHDHIELLNTTWAHIGVRINPEIENKRRLDGLLQTIQTSLPTTETPHRQWLQFAYRWAELNALIHHFPHLPQNHHTSTLHQLQTKIDNTFTAWIHKRFAGLVSLPPLPPVMLHHIPRFMARALAESKQTKTALLLIDGLSLDQWITLRDTLTTQLPRIEFHEDSVFSWIPTTTAISRQALFAGKPPIYFPSSIHTTTREPTHWTHFWIDQGLKKEEILYQKGLNHQTSPTEELLSNPKIRTAGLIVDKIDKIMHGMELGAAGMHNQIRQWANQGFLAALITQLLDHRYSIYLTSDHGNIEAAGCGRPTEGAAVDRRGERVRIYHDELLREKTNRLFPNAVPWPPTGLPENVFPLIAPHRSAFVNKNQQTVSHGGISIEEVIVPLVKIRRSEA